MALGYAIALMLALGFCSPLWLVIAFGAYVAGRGKQFRLSDLFLLVGLEAIAIVIAIACNSGLTVHRA